MRRQFSERLLTHQRSALNDGANRRIVERLEQPVVQDPSKYWSMGDPILQENL